MMRAVPSFFPKCFAFASLQTPNPNHFPPDTLPVRSTKGPPLSPNRRTQGKASNRQRPSFPTQYSSSFTTHSKGTLSAPHPPIQNQPPFRLALTNLFVDSQLPPFDPPAFQPPGPSIQPPCLLKRQPFTLAPI